MKGKIIQIMGPAVDVEFDGYLLGFEDGFEIALEIIKHITYIIIDMAICFGFSFKVEVRIRSPCFFEKSVDLTKICKKDRIWLNL